MSYKLNNVDINSFFAVPVLQGQRLAVQGIFDLPKRKGITERNWGTSIEPFVDAEDIELEGRELILYSAQGYDMAGNENLITNSSIRMETNSYKLGEKNLSRNLVIGEEVTISAYGILASGQNLYVGLYPSTAGLAIIEKNPITGIYTGTFTFHKYSEYPNDVANKLVFYNYTAEGNLTGYIDKIKLEVGNTPTPWRPSNAELIAKYSEYKTAIKACTSLYTPLESFSVVNKEQTDVEKKGSYSVFTSRFWQNNFQLKSLTKDASFTGAFQLEGYDLKKDFGISVIETKGIDDVPGRIEVSTTEFYTGTQYRELGEVELSCIMKAESLSELYDNMCQFQALLYDPGFKYLVTPYKTIYVWHKAGFKASYLADFIVKFSLKLVLNA